MKNTCASVVKCNKKNILVDKVRIFHHVNIQVKIENEPIGKGSCDNADRTFFAVCHQNEL